VRALRGKLKRDKMREEEVRKTKTKTLFDFFLFGFIPHVWDLGGKGNFCSIIEATYFLVGGMF
jgi:hypothetical protein